MRRGKSYPRLRNQLILTILVSSLGMALVISLPFILHIHRQASLQSQLLLENTILTTQAFLKNEQADLQNLAVMVSQRPTLIRLLEEQDLVTLPNYLDTLAKGVNLDFLLVCASEQELAVYISSEPPAGLCSTNSTTGYAIPPSGNDTYLYTAHHLELTYQPDDWVIVGKSAAPWLSMLQRETGSAYFIIQQDKIINTSEPSMGEAPAAELLSYAHRTVGASLEQQAIAINSRRFLVADQLLDRSLDIHLVSALNVDEQIAVQQNFTRSLIIGGVLIVLAAFGLGIWLSQRISSPIVKLADAAQKLRQGNLDAPVNVQSSILEINQLANTLEDARITLQHTVSQLQAEKAWIEHLLNSIVEGTLTLDHQNRITFASAGVGKILISSPDQITGKMVDDVLITAQGEAAFSNQLPNTGQQARISIQLANGKERLLSISTANLLPPIATNANRALVIRDVSNEEYVHRFLGDFMANITHEFRTPLSALGASTELLLEHLPNLTHVEIQELLVTLNLGIINLQTLIDNLIEAASMEAGRFKVTLQPIPLDTILEYVKLTMQPLAEKYNVRLEIFPALDSLIVRADQRRTAQVLINLISNAIKHSPEGGCIQVAHTTTTGGHLFVEVTDEGSGIPANIGENLFQRFAHLASETKQTRQGLGLGLSVVKAIVEAQHGEVGVKSRASGGAAFWFTLPLDGEA